MKNKVKEIAYLFGPFVGELSWELSRFAPYAIHIKKKHPTAIIIILTRDSRFDLYGKYADIFIPLQLVDYDKEAQDCFRLNGMKILYYEMIKDSFFNKYKEKYFIKSHFFPDVSWRYNIKYQYPRHKMDYDFLPRNKNKDIINEVLEKIDSFILVDNLDNLKLDDLQSINYNYFMIEKIANYVSEKKGKKFSFIGCLIEAIKSSSVVIGNMNSILSRLSLLLKKPVISINEKMTNDSIRLLNPLNTPIIKCNSLREGIKIYENNI